MTAFLNNLMNLGATAIGTILFAAVVLIAGLIVIKTVIRGIGISKAFGKLDRTVQTFSISLIKVGLYTILIISTVGILGVPMASIVAILASAGLAVGLALQGALSNFAGGIMILFFKPFRVGDYIQTSGCEGTVVDISVFYTNVLTVDNKRITIPNGTLMSANVTNYSHEETRRVDLTVFAGFETDAGTVIAILSALAASDGRIREDPPPFARQTGVRDSAREFQLRVWCKTEDYWDLYFDLLAAADAAFAHNGIAAPAAKMDVRLSDRARRCPADD